MTVIIDLSMDPFRRGGGGPPCLKTTCDDETLRETPDCNLGLSPYSGECCPLIQEGQMNPREREREREHAALAHLQAKAKPASPPIFQAEGPR